MQCHEYLLELIDAPLNDAPLDAVGRLTAGSAFFSTGETERWIRDTRLLDPADAAPFEFLVDTPYPPTASALKVPSNSRIFDCRPCALANAATPLQDREDALTNELDVEQRGADPSPAPFAGHVKRQDGTSTSLQSAATPSSTVASSTTQVLSATVTPLRAAASSCPISSASRPTNTAEAAQAAQSAVSDTETAVEAAAAALAASTASQAIKDATAAAVAAAQALPAAAAALVSSSDRGLNLR